MRILFQQRANAPKILQTEVDIYRYCNPLIYLSKGRFRDIEQLDRGTLTG